MTDRPQVRADVEQRIAQTPIEGTTEEKRAAFRALFAPIPDWPRSDIGGIPCGDWPGETPGTILWLHGGGLVLGDPGTHAAAAARVSELTGRRVVLPDYPKAPESLWPAQIDAAEAVLAALTGPIYVIGDSVGGLMALILAQRHPSRFTGLGLVSPNTDRTGQSVTRGRDTDDMNDDEGDKAFARTAFGDRPADDPEVSPLIGPLGDLPPTAILCAGDEVLQDDSLLLARAAGLEGAPVTLRVWPGLFHLWPLWPDAMPEAAEALRFLSDHACAALSAGDARSD